VEVRSPQEMGDGFEGEISRADRDFDIRIRIDKEKE